MIHLAHKRPAFWILFYGVYTASCACAKFFTPVIEGVGFMCGYTDGVRQKVVDLLVRDHLSAYKVQAPLKEDFLLDVSVGFIFDCFQWAYDKIDRAAYWQWALKNLSGALCIDEVHDCGRAILVATDPVNDFTVAFLVVPKNSQRNMNRFLDLLKKRGLKVRVAVTDGSRLYKQALLPLEGPGTPALPLPLPARPDDGPPLGRPVHPQEASGQPPPSQGTPLEARTPP